MISRSITTGILDVTIATFHFSSIPFCRTLNTCVMAKIHTYAISLELRPHIAVEELTKVKFDLPSIAFERDMHSTSESTS